MANKPSPGKIANAVVGGAIAVAGSVTGPPSPVPPLDNYADWNIGQQSAKTTRDIRGATRDKGRGSNASSKK